MAMRSTLFRNLEAQFKGRDRETVTQLTAGAFLALTQQFNGKIKGQTLVTMLAVGARLGIASKTGTLKAQERELIDRTFGTICSGGITDIYSFVAAPVSEDDYGTAQATTGSNEIALVFLYMILGFAYIDGEVDDDVLGELDSIFGLNMLAAFAQSGQEDVPVPQEHASGLEAEIAAWFRADDQMRPLKKIVEKFPGHSEEEIKKACDSLCEKGILYGGDNFIGCMYGLA